MKIELNEQESNALLQLIHLAVKAEGMAVAQAGVILAEKIKQAAEAEKAQELARPTLVSPSKKESA